jgi:hypothetical protein
MTDVELTDELFIVKSGTNVQVGHIKMSGNTLMSIHVSTEYQGCGYGTQAIQLLKEELQGDLSEIQTTAVVDPRMESILQGIDGFTRDFKRSDGVYFECQL